MVGTYPWALMNAACFVLFGGASVVSWWSADRVVAENRAWTRAWRILLAALFPPFTSIYILVRYWPSARRSARIAARSTSA